MTISITLNRGTAAFTSAAAKFGTSGLAGGVYANGGAPRIFGTAGDLISAGTVEGFVATAATSLRCALGIDGTAWFGISADGKALAHYGSTPGADVVLSGPVINDGNFHHLAIVFPGDGTGKFYVDGTLAGSGAASNVGASTAFQIGGINIGGTTYDWALSGNGKIDEVRLSNTARYSGNSFAVPTGAFTADSFTVALYHLEGDATDASTSAAPSPPDVALTASGSNNVIAYDAAPYAGTGTIAGYSLYEGTTTGGESATAVLTNTGAGAGSFTRPTVIPKFYVVRAFNSDGTALYSAPSRELAAVATPPSVSAISVNSAGGIDTITYSAPTAGTYGVAGVSLYAGDYSGTETLVTSNTGTNGGTFTNPTPTTGKRFYYVRAYDSATTPNYSAASNEVSTGSPVSILPNSSAIAYSPFTWDVTSSRALSNCGGYFSTLVGDVTTASTITLSFDVSNMNAEVSRVEYRVDRGPWVEFQLSSGTLTITVPTASAAWPKHLVEVVVKTTAENARWASPYLSAVKFTGMTLNPRGTVEAPGKASLVGLFYGDSITEGINTLSSVGGATNRSDTVQGWAYDQRLLLGAEVGIVGFGGQGAVVQGTSNSVPNWQTTWNQIADGLPRSFATAPDFVWVNHGTNDARNGVTSANFQAAMVGVLNQLLAATPRQTKIFVQLPFGLYYGVAVYQAAIAATANPGRIKFVDTTGWWNSADAPDGLHPYGYVNHARLAPLVAGAIRAGLNAGATWIKRSDGSVKQISSSRY